MLKVNIRFINHSLEDRRQLQALVNDATPAVVLLQPEEGAAPGTVSDVRRDTSRVFTHKVLDLSQEGCIFSSSTAEGLAPGTQICARLVADGTTLDLASRVVHLGRDR